MSLSTLAPTDVFTKSGIDYAKVSVPGQRDFLLPLDTLRKSVGAELTARGHPFSGPITIMAGGDSITANQFSTLSDIAAAVITTNDVGPMCQGLALAGSDASVNVQAQGGISSPTWISGYMPAALVSGAQIWLVRIGTNDINNMGAATVAATVAALWSNLLTIYAAARSVGAFFLDPAIPPIGNDGTNNYSTQNKTTAINQINALKKAYWAANPYWGEYVDSYAVWADAAIYNNTATNGNGYNPYKSTYGYDQVHPSNLGCYYESLLLWKPIFQRILPARRLVASSADYIGNDSASKQIFPNPCLTGTGGSNAGTSPLTGSVPDNLHPYNTDAQITGTTAIAAANSGVGNKLAITVAVAGSPSLTSPKNLYIYTDAFNANAINKHIYTAAFRIKITANTPCVSRLTCRLNKGDGSESLQWGNPTYANASTQLYPATFEFLACITVPKRFLDVSGLFLNWQIYFGATATSCVIELEQIEVRDLGI